MDVVAGDGCVVRLLDVQMAEEAQEKVAMKDSRMPLEQEEMVC